MLTSPHETLSPSAAHAYQPTMLVHKCALVALAIFGSRGVDAENTGLHGTTTSSTELDAPSKAALLAQANAKPGRVRGLKHRNKRSKASKKAKSNSEGPCTTSPVPKGQFRTNEELRIAIREYLEQDCTTTCDARSDYGGAVSPLMALPRL